MLEKRDTEMRVMDAMIACFKSVASGELLLLIRSA